MRLALCAALLFASASAVEAEELTVKDTVTAAEWAAYRDRFVDPGGRVIDDGNGGISHSESQGYGLILAYAANDRASFESIWFFTRTQLLLRDDGLAFWRWDPATTPHVTDRNNASDGDILIAYALGLAGEGWAEPRYRQAGARLAASIGRAVVIERNGVPLLLPGVEGFDERSEKDRLILNLSYFVFEALPVLARLDAATDWAALGRSGRGLVAAARFGETRLPTDWIDYRDGKVSPAKGFDPVYGYNAFRIPLYLARAGETDADLLGPFRAAAEAGPAVVDVTTGKPKEALGEPGYAAVGAVLGCILDGRKMPDALESFAPTLYYPSTLHLLSLAYLRERHPQCL
ncbi:glycosyl hydrolase family 8 [Prosthecomicrobium pneumaticum]|uniref:Glucanase n=1 Tax=Prosthecomicrobium pneumaticum TaxID=81895 RepID=A0A7W9CUW0_9HYPH|nr:glycosyl hydrolase family 8 [Prosthecomicrobium pneumaticum]MBB5752370.1 endoglucanase [Prosthecomicrobium pneumaticum]